MKLHLTFVCNVRCIQFTLNHMFVNSRDQVTHIKSLNQNARCRLGTGTIVYPVTNDFLELLLLVGAYVQGMRAL